MYIKWLHFILCTVFVAYYVDKVTAEPQPILGGKLAKKGEFGYHVSIEAFNSSLCGGGIIDDRFVVTAAHCVLDKQNQFDGYPLKVVVGTQDLQAGCKHKVTADVEQVFVPAEYDQRTRRKDRTGDIAVLKLKTDLGIRKHKYLKKLKLPSEDKTYANKKVVVTGFGYNKYNISNQSGSGTNKCGSTDYKLRYAKAVVIDNNQCEVLRMKTIHRKLLCASVISCNPNEPAGVCNGDSGGPLVYKSDQLIGIVSISHKDCRENDKPAIYTRVWSFVDFITKVLEGRIDATIRHIALNS